MTTRNPFLRVGLQWRRPWWFWQGLALVASTLLAPTFLTIGVLLTRDARSDHPVFWPSLMVIVVLANALAVAGANQWRHRRPAMGRNALALCYCVWSMLGGSAMFLVFGFGTGFLTDFFVTAPGSAVPGGKTVLLSLMLAGGYSLLSFAHAGLLYAWLAFFQGDGSPPVAAGDWRQGGPVM